MFKKLFFPIAAAMAIAIILLLANVFAKSGSDNKIQYAALGDSITYGYALPPSAKNYPTLLAENLNADLTNYAVVGMDSEQLLQRLKNGDYDVGGADLITLGIGSNDLLIPFQEIIAGKLGIAPTQNVLGELIFKYRQKPLEAIEKIAEIEKEIKNSLVFETAAEKFRLETFPNIVREIRRKNKKAKIIVLNLYNPYYGADILGLNIGQFAQKYIDKINETFLNPQDFETVNIHDIFRRRGMTNVNISLTDIKNISVDPHPTEQGHMVIFTLIEELLQNADFNKNYLTCFSFYTFCIAENNPVM